MFKLLFIKSPMKRARKMKEWGVFRSCGDRVMITSRKIPLSSRLRSIGENVWIDNLVQVTIGSNVCISQGAMLLCGNHNYKLPTFDLIVKPIVIENGAWVGAKSTVCPGVTMSSHSVLSVGSVASKDLASYSVYRGNPATFVTKRIISES